MKLYDWRGHEIENQAEWARRNGVPMVKYEATRRIPDGFGNYKTETEIGAIPEPFWDQIMMHNGWHFKEVRKYFPS
jgi:hypothetical protein